MIRLDIKYNKLKREHMRGLDLQKFQKAKTQRSPRIATDSHFARILVTEHKGDY